MKSIHITVRWLHWIIAAAVLFMLASGFSLGLIEEKSTKIALMKVHKATGTLILMLCF